MADRVVVEEPAKGKRLGAILRQRVNARCRLLAHRVQQAGAYAAQTGITEPAKIFLQHANPSPPTRTASESRREASGKSFRTCAAAIGSMTRADAGIIATTALLVSAAGG
ncbi:MAG TPA: hypothetical protein VGE94_08825, partial [Chloroflexota bacterium]